MKKLVLLLSLLVIAGCSGPEKENHEKMHHWFERGTGLSLPRDAEPIGVRVGWSDQSVYLDEIYLKLKVGREFLPELEKHLRKIHRNPIFNIPQEIQNWPHWDTSGRQLTFYEKKTGELSGYISHLAVDKNSGVVFCRIQEYGP